jgi:hypothetical protein
MCSLSREGSGKDSAPSAPSERFIPFAVSVSTPTPSFPWLYLDYNTLQNAAIANGLKCELLLEGEHFDYLAKLSI